MVIKEKKIKKQCCMIICEKHLEKKPKGSNRTKEKDIPRIIGCQCIFHIIGTIYNMYTVTGTFVGHNKRHSNLMFILKASLIFINIALQQVVLLYMFCAKSIRLYSLSFYFPSPTTPLLWSLSDVHPLVLEGYRLEFLDDTK